MMLIHSSIPSSIETAVPSAFDHGQQEFTQVWISGDGAWQEFPKRNTHPQNGYGRAVPVTLRDHKDDSSCSPNLLDCSPLSTVTTMSESSAPISVYKRRKIQRNPAAVLPTSASTSTRSSLYVYKRSKIQRNPAAVFPTSASTSTRPSEYVYKRRKNQRNPAPVFPTSASTSTRLSDYCLSANSSDMLGSVDEHPLCDEHRAENDMHKDFRLFGNGSCSSSKSSMDLVSASLKHELDDNGECSSSGALIEEALREDLSEKDLCIALLRTHGVLGGVKPPNTCASTEHMENQNDRSCLLSCKICLQSEITLKMLICDHCEEGFHVSCCNPSIKKIPDAEWLCHSCFRKKLKNMETGSSKSLNVVCDNGKWKTLTSKDYIGPIESMFKDIEPYTSKVRVGKEFQAEVPDWSGPKPNEDDHIGDAVELNPLEYGSSQGWDSNKPSTVGSIGNWLQCQEVVYGVGEGVDRTICGKWRRAPLFEVQTDNWECFSSVHWDPTHSDCAVPQELDTNQVLKQLKYIEMLRPRFVAKMSKSSSVKKGSDCQEHTQDGRNTRTI